MYVITRLVVGFSIIPIVYLLGFLFRRLKNATGYTILILYLLCWLLYNSFIVLKDSYPCGLECSGGIDVLFHIMLLNPFVYLVESSLISKLADIYYHTLAQLVIGLLFTLILLLMNSVAHNSISADTFKQNADQSSSISVEDIGMTYPNSKNPALAGVTMEANGGP